jgi:hypothetical protein
MEDESDDTDDKSDDSFDDDEFDPILGNDYGEADDNMDAD